MPPAAAMALPTQAPSNSGDPLYPELWRACAGPLVTVPRVGDLVFYFPQGHIEQVEASMNQVAQNQMRLYDLPSKLLCRVLNVELKAETDTDEVYVQTMLMPEPEILDTAGRKSWSATELTSTGDRIMAGVYNAVDGRSSSTKEMPSDEQNYSENSLSEWRSSQQVVNGVPSTSPAYSDTDDDDCGPSELYGKFTWRIDNFSQINKRALRSNSFDVGGYEWYILMYPQGCDVCNHLSLFLCVANRDTLLPGWNYFAQFTIAVINRDPTKSKYSDTLHRFWKEEHDWGWKKYMRLSKLHEGFIVEDVLTIKVQVQVVREKTDRPFRSLDGQYRRELIKVYLSDVEQICQHFIGERRSKLSRLIGDKLGWSSFSGFWLAMDPSVRRHMTREKTETILKALVKQFFIEKEVTSTLVIDSLYSGFEALEYQSKNKKEIPELTETDARGNPMVLIDDDMFVLADDVILLFERAALDARSHQPLPIKDFKGSQNRTKDDNSSEEFDKYSIERDDRWLTELGLKTLEIFALAHIFSRIEVAYQEAMALKRQEELIREEASERAGIELKVKAKRSAADKKRRGKNM